MREPIHQAISYLESQHEAPDHWWAFSRCPVNESAAWRACQLAGQEGAMVGCITDETELRTTLTLLCRLAKVELKAVRRGLFRESDFGRIIEAAKKLLATPMRLETADSWGCLARAEELAAEGCRTVVIACVDPSVTGESFLELTREHPGLVVLLFRPQDCLEI